MAKKPKPYVGRVYLGQDENGKQLWHWVGRFERKRDRDAAVARAKVERPWERDAAPNEWTVDAWADRFLARRALRQPLELVSVDQPGQPGVFEQRDRHRHP
jgi:hypothetical protein